MDRYEMLLDLVRTRRSVRRFSDRPVGRELLERVIEAARWAPSNHNRQGWRFVVFDDPVELREIGGRVCEELEAKIRAAPRVGATHARAMLGYATLFADAPCVLMTMHKRSPSVSGSLLADTASPILASGEPLSVAMAVQNLLLAAHALGLGACVLTAPMMAPKALARIPDLPPGFEPTCMVILGYPAEQPSPPQRKPVDQILAYRRDRP